MLAQNRWPDDDRNGIPRHHKSLKLPNKLTFMPLPKPAPLPEFVVALCFIAAFSLPSSAALPAGAAHPPIRETRGVSKDETVKSTVIFISWDNVYKGRLEPLVDPAMVSPEGRKV